MKKITVFIISIFTLVSCFNSSKKETTDLPNLGNVILDSVFVNHKPIKNKTKIKNTLKDYYHNVWEKSNMSGGILVANGNDILLEEYRGFGRENKQMPINATTPLHIASISKTFTAMAIMKLIEAGYIDLNQKITSFFPAFPYKDITIFHLLSHRSGLPKYEYFLEDYKYKPKNKYVTNQEVLDFMIEHRPELSRKTDTGFMYCNTNFVLLALVIEKITKKTYPQAMQEMIFEPLEMNNTFVFQEKDIPTASQSFYQNNKLYPLNELDLIYGDKNIYTTPRDLFNFSKAMYSDKFLSKDLVDKVFTPYSNEKKGVNNYGLGFRMKVFDVNNKLTFHNGWWHGSNSVFVHLLNSETTIIAIGNKYTRRIYSAVALSSLFEPFPYELDEIIYHK